MFEVIAMVKQLGIPTWFMTLSCADLRWPELFLTTENKQQYIDYIDRHVQAFLPDESNEPELYELVKMYQKHNHSKTCREYRNVKCRFNFGQFFTKKTIIAEPLDDNLGRGNKNTNP